MKDWSKERWRKLYVREALEQRPWPVMARGLRDYLLRLADDDGGLIRDADDPLGALLVALGAHDSEAELLRVALELLRRDGFLTGSARSSFVGNLPVAQSWHSPPVSETAPKAEVAASLPQTSTERVRRHRERLRQASAAEPPTLRSAAVGNVPDGPDTSSTNVTSSRSGNVSSAVPASRGSSDLISSGNFLDPKKYKEIDHPPSSARASSVSGSTTPVATRSVSSPSESKEEDEDELLNFSGSREEALRLAVPTRARLVIDRPALADVAQPETWPEVARVAQVFAHATGATEQRLGRYQRDPGVRAIVELYAAGFTQSELEHVVQALPGQSWWSGQGKRLGLSSLSIEVVRRNLPDARRQPLSPEVARVLEAVRRRRVG